MLASTLLLLLAAAPGSGGPSFEPARAAMIREIEAEVRAAGEALGLRALDPRVARALRRVPRHRFVPPAAAGAAYANRPLPIGYGQTISQPFIVAVMTDLLDLEPGDRVLEIGTGSGYQTAVLAELVSAVFSIEIIEPLARRAAGTLEALGYDSVQTRVGDGYFGWPEAAPFDAILVAAAASHVPPPLVAQLRPGGRMILPVGSRFTVQHLVLVEKDASGAVRARQLLPVQFVPLTGGHDRNE